MKEVARRFTYAIKRDWGSLVEMWERDKLAHTQERERRSRRGRRRGETDGEEEVRRRQVVALLSDGQISRAMTRVTSHGVASMDDPAVKAQVAAKYPARGRPLPARVPRGQPVEHLRALRDVLKGLQPGSSPGCGGMRPEFLRVVGEVMGEEDMEVMEEFGMVYLRGELPHWFYRVWLTVNTVPIFKTTGRCTVRPLGLRTPLLKLFHKQVVSQNIREVKSYLEPQQLGMSVAGAPKLVFSIRALLNSNRSFVCVKIDCKNAYNEQSRRATIDAFLEEPTLRHLAHFCAVTLAPVNGLEAGGTMWGEAEEGDTQGDSAASMRFCVALQPSLRRLDEACGAGGSGGMARGGADDITAIGPADIVFRAVVEFGREVEERCLLHWERTKSEVFSWDGVAPAGTPDSGGLPLAGEEVEETFQPGFLMYGVPVGTDEYCTHKLMEIARRIASDAQQTAQLLAGERQSLWTALRVSTSRRFDYWLQLAYPPVVEPVARWLDNQLWSMLETATGLTIARVAYNTPWNCVLPVPVVGKEENTFQEWVVRQPCKLGGFGLPALEDTAGPAFLGALEQSVPFFFGEDGICPQLSGVLGGAESFGEDAPETIRWRVMLGSGCREGEELRRVWNHLKEEEQQAATWLNREVRENLGKEVEGVGGTSCNGSTRGKVVEERAATRGELISQGLKEHPQWDKLSTAWLHSLPSPDTSLSSAEFSEAAAADLCLPSPANHLG